MSDEAFQSFILKCEHEESAVVFGLTERGLMDQPGWYCAQRRPGRALGWLQAMYQDTKKTTMPDILAIVDDDTSVVRIFRTSHL